MRLTLSIFITITLSTSIPLRLLSGEVKSLNIDRPTLNIEEVCEQTQNQFGIPIVTFPDPPATEQIIENQHLSLTLRQEIFFVFVNRLRTALKFCQVSSSGDTVLLRKHRIGEIWRLESCGDNSKIFVFIRKERKCHVFTQVGIPLPDFHFNSNTLPQARGISHDGSLFAMIHCKSIVMKDVQTSRDLHSIPLHQNSDLKFFNRIQICSDGKIAVNKSGLKPYVIVYDFDGNQLHRIQGNVRLSPDFQFAAIQDNTNLQIMEVLSMCILYKLDDKTKFVNSHVTKRFTPEGRCVFFNNLLPIDGHPGFWYVEVDIDSRKTIHEVTSKGIAFISDDGKFLTSRTGDGKYVVCKVCNIEDVVGRFEGTDYITNTFVSDGQSAVLHCIPHCGKSEMSM